MAVVPAWTTREWRPLARELCARVREANASSPSHSSSFVTPAASDTCVNGAEPIDHDDEDDDDHVSREKRIDDALAADRVVTRLYSHRFLECHRKQVTEEIHGMVAKFQIHALDERGQRLQELVAMCIEDHYQVVKVLLELAQSPTMASDEQVALGEDDAYVAAQQREQQTHKQKQQMHDQLLEELFEISTNDEWYQEWDNDDDEYDDNDSENELSDEDSDVETAGIGGKAPKRQSVLTSMEAGDQDLEEAGSGEEDEPMTSSDEVDASRVRFPSAIYDLHDQDSEAILLRDELLLRYYPHVQLDSKPSPDGVAETKPMDVDAGSSQKLSISVLSMETPALLYAALGEHHERQKTACGNEHQHRVVHERTLVTAVFQALTGVESSVFEVVSVSDSSELFHSDFTSSTIQLSKVARTLAVAHLSPTALYHLLAHFERAATELQVLRDLVEFIAADSFDEVQRSCTLEGLAQAISTIVRGFNQVIWSAEQQQFSADPSHPQATLLGAYGTLKSLFGEIAWLKDTLVECFRAFSDRRHHEVRAAERAKDVLDALYSQLETEFVQGIQDNYGDLLKQKSQDSAAAWSRYDMLLHLFVSALTPYLDLLHHTLFERGHQETLVLSDELFFVTPLASKRPVIAAADPSSSASAERSQAFKDALLALAPFEVDPMLVPAFLSPSVSLMSEAIASRQMKNRYLQQHMGDANESRSHTQQHLERHRHKANGQETKTLSELFLDEIGQQSGTLGSPASVHQGRVAVPGASAHPNSTTFQYMPFNRIMEQCLLRHVEQKQDVFSMLSAHVLERMQRNPIAWADSERMNTFYQTAIQTMQEENVLSPAQRRVGSRLCIRINATQLESLGVARRIDIFALKCLYFTFSTPQPLRVLFSASILRKYSRLATFMLQVKAVESAIIKFKRSLRHRTYISLIEHEIRGVLLQINDMLHYTKSLMNYLSSQIANGRWEEVRKVLETSQSISSMDEAHEQYLDQLLNKFFLLDKHTTVIQYILTTFNHIMRYVSQVDELVKALARKYTSRSSSSSDVRRSSLGEEMTGDEDHSDHDEDGAAGLQDTTAQPTLLGKQHKQLNEELVKSASEFKRQSHFLVVMLTAMHKHGASPHVAEILTQLNFNFFYHQQEHHHAPAAFTRVTPR
ncbi:Gamma-tubulin complex, dgrip91/spc98 component, partial [Globisporangium splendens]